MGVVKFSFLNGDGHDIGLSQIRYSFSFFYFSK